MLHVLIFKCMLTSNIYTLNRSYGHLARSPALRGRPPDGESFQMRPKRKGRKRGRKAAHGGVYVKQAAAVARVKGRNGRLDGATVEIFSQITDVSSSQTP